MFEKALNSNADYIFLDLEDAVSPNDKLSARKNIIKALSEINWREKGKTISVRINSLDTHYMYRDVIDVMEQVGDKIDTILVPKVGTSSDVYTVDCLLTQIENKKKYFILLIFFPSSKYEPSALQSCKDTFAKKRISSSWIISKNV